MNKLQIKVLSYCLKRQRTFAQIASHCKISVDTLRDNVFDPELQSFITADDTPRDLEDFTAKANNSGISYIENLRKDNFRFRFPTVLSLAAIIISVIALLK